MNCVITESKEFKDYSEQMTKELGISKFKLAFYVARITDIYQRHSPISFGLPTKEHLLKYMELRKSGDQEALDLYLDKADELIEGKNLYYGRVPKSFKATAAEMERLDINFDSQTLRDRVSLVAYRFRTEVDNELRRQQLKIQKEIDDAQAAGDGRAALLATSRLESLNRFKIVKELGADYFKNKVKEFFTNYLKEQDSTHIKLEEERLLNLGYSAEDAKRGSVVYTERRRAAYEQMLAVEEVNGQNVSVFNALMQEAVSEVNRTDADMQLLVRSENVDNDEDAIDEESEIDNNIETEDNAEAGNVVRESWQTDIRRTSSKSTLSIKVRSILENLPKIDREGYQETDDLGNDRTLNSSYAHAVLIEELRNIIDAEDMVTRLKQLTTRYPWIASIVEKVEEDPEIKTLFFTAYNKDFLNYWVQQKRFGNNGTIVTTGVNLNRFTEGRAHLMDAWRDNELSGTQLCKLSMYDEVGNLNTANITEINTKVKAALQEFNGLDDEGKQSFLFSDAAVDNLLMLLNSAGISVERDVLREVILPKQDKDEQGNIVTDSETAKTNYAGMLNGIRIISDGAQGWNNVNKRSDGTIKKIGLYEKFAGAYYNIAKVIGNSSEEVVESCVNELGKTYYAHTPPSYLGKLLKKLSVNNRNKPLSEEDSKKYSNYTEKVIMEEFGRSSWFCDQNLKKEWQKYRNSKRPDEISKAQQLFKSMWLSPWVRDIINYSGTGTGWFDNAGVRNDDIGAHKVILNVGKIGYEDLGPADRVVAMFYEYDQGALTQNGSKAWFAVPIMSDKKSFEFIKWNKSKDREDAIGKLVHVVRQEYNRIQLVRQRQKLIKSGEASEIEGYDKNGIKFNFFPQLNNYKVNGRDFIEVLEDAVKKGDPERLEGIIRKALKDVIEQSFAKDLRMWEEYGVFDTAPNSSSLKLISGMQRMKYDESNKVMKELLGLKEILPSNVHPIINELYEAFTSGHPFAAIESSKSKGNAFQVLEDLIEYYNKKQDENPDMPNLSLDFLSLPLILQRFRMFYYDSYVANSQIMELTTTDIAHYGSFENFQKRNQQIHAPTIRLNTSAEWVNKKTGEVEKVGREIERNLYFEDPIEPSDLLDFLKNITTKWVEEKKITKKEAAYILKQYEKVNVTDGQAYRSPASYRRMMIMAGRWNDEFEKAYNNLKSGNFSFADAAVFLTPTKPFLYTQMHVFSGIPGEYIKVPIQHKNSEFVLLGLFGAIAQKENNGKSKNVVPSKWEAIVSLMEDNDIDTIQFHSAVKVGSSNVISLKGTKGMNAAQFKNYLEKQAYLGKYYNKEKSERVIQKASYEDYGIISETPTHFFTTVQAIGTQVKKLIGADIETNELTLNGVKLTRKEWRSIYEELLTAEVMQTFKKLQLDIKDPKKLEALLISEILKNNRYDNSLIQACTLNEEGHFNLELFDPVQGNRIMELLNSIVKKRLIKHEVKGGTAVQVSVYGTDDLEVVKDKVTGAVTEIQCRISVYDYRLIEPLLQEDGSLDIAKLEEAGLDKIFGYRIPTEDKYSMAHLKIVGFLPMATGAVIQLPKEITTISGSDFDIDKMYIMLPEFEVSAGKLNESKVKQSFETYLEGLVNTPNSEKRLRGQLKSFIEAAKENSELIKEYVESVSLSDTEGIFADWLKRNQRNRNLYDTPQLSKVESTQWSSFKHNLTTLNAANHKVANKHFTSLNTPSTPMDIWAGSRGQNQELSNMYERPFTINNIKFKSVEQYFQYKKAITFNDAETAQKILECKNAFEARSLGKKVKNFKESEWNKVREGIMEEGIRESFTQKHGRKKNPFLDILVATGDAPLTHSRDRGEYAEIFPSILMKVRREIQEQLDNKRPTSKTQKQLDEYKKERSGLVTGLLDDIHSMSRAERNNLILDAYWSIMSNSDTAHKILNPGNFDVEKRFANIYTITQNSTEQEIAERIQTLRKFPSYRGKSWAQVYFENRERTFDKDTAEKFEKIGFKTSSRTTYDSGGNPAYTHYYLSSLDNYFEDLSDEDIKDWKEEVDSFTNPLSPQTMVHFQTLNMSGNKAISVAAVQNATHALLQHTTVAVANANAFTFCGEQRTSLHNVRARDGITFISKNLASIIQAAVDNAKAHTLSELNFNDFTYNVATFLIRLGYSIDEVGTLLNQPIIKEMTNRYSISKSRREYKSREEIIKECLQEFEDEYKALTNHVVNKSIFKYEKFELSSLKDAISLKRIMDSDPNNLYLENRLGDYYQFQVFVGMLFEKMSEPASDLATLSNLLRADAQSGAVGPHHADTIQKISRLNSFIGKKNNTLIHIEFLRDIALKPFSFRAQKYNEDREDYLREKKKYELGMINGLNDPKIYDRIKNEIRGSLLPSQMAYTIFGQGSAEFLFQEYFPYFSPAYTYAIDAVSGYSIKGRLRSSQIKRIIQAADTYLLSKCPFFGETPATKNKKGMTAWEKRSYFINYFPNVLKNMKENPSIAEELENNDFVRQLVVYQADEKCPVPYILLKGVGKRDAVANKNISAAWLDLLKSDKKAIRDLGYDLIRYAFYVRGLTYGPYSFGHVAPIVARLAIPGYSETLRQAWNMSTTDGENIAHQFILNNLDDNSFSFDLRDQSFIDSHFVKAPTDQPISNSDELKDVIDIPEDIQKPQRSRQALESFAPVTKDIIRTSDGEFKAILYDYIKIQVGNDYAHYKLTYEEVGGEMVAKYKRITGLGVPYHFMEYEYGTAGEDIKTTIHKREMSDKIKEINEKTAQKFDSWLIETTPVIQQKMEEESITREFHEADKTNQSARRELSNVRERLKVLRNDGNELLRRYNELDERSQLDMNLTTEEEIEFAELTLKIDKLEEEGVPLAQREKELNQMVDETAVKMKELAEAANKIKKSYTTANNNKIC